MTNPSDRLTRIRTGGPIGPADAEWLLGEVERLQKREKDLMDVIDSRDRALGFVPLDDALHPGPSISKAFANSPRRVSHEPLPVVSFPLLPIDPKDEALVDNLVAKRLAGTQGASRDASSPCPSVHDHMWANVVDVCDGPCKGRILGRKCVRCGFFDGRYDGSTEKSGEQP